MEKPRSRAYRSKGPRGLALVVGLMSAASCHKDAAVTVRTVTMHVPAACAADGGAYATYYEQGDFEPSTPGAGHPAGAVGTTLTELDDRARALVVQATQNNSGWSGVGSVPVAGDIDVLLLPSLASCPMTGHVGATLGARLAPIGGARVMLAGGTTTYVARLDTGEVTAAAPDLLRARLHPTVTAFGGGALVAGGTEQDTAEVYTNALGGFDHLAILLSGPRGDHGAVTLANGQTLLVGGVGGADGQTVLASLETVDPATRLSSVSGLATLAMPRKDPEVMRLASGEVLVAGGLDGSGNPVTTLEWTQPDGSASPKPAQTLPASTARAFIALAAGGALAVLAPPTNAPPGFQSTWVIGADGVVEAATPVPGSLTRPVLFGGAGGAPLLWTGDRWLRWQPYAGAFGPVTVLDKPGGIDAFCSPDPGLAMWLDPTTQQLAALRFDVRDAYSPLQAPALLAHSTDDTAPDRLASAGLIGPGDMRGFPLGPGASVFVTDRTYADVAVQVSSPSGSPAILVLRDDLGNELEVGGASCPVAFSLTGSDLLAERRGGAVTWQAGGTSGTCNVARPDARLSLGLRGMPVTGSAPGSWSIRRLGSP